MTPQGFDAQIGNKVVAVTLVEPTLVASALEQGLVANVATELIPEPLLYLGGFETGGQLEARVCSASPTRARQTSAYWRGCPFK